MPVAEEIPPAQPSGSGFSQAVLDSLTASIAVLDRDGMIVCVNQAWRRFAAENGGGEHTGVGVNYLAASRLGSGPYAEEAQAAHAGIQAVLDGRQPEFSLKYPCHDGAQKRWFLMQVTPTTERAGGGAVISHQDITARKKAEDALRFSELRYRRLFETAADGILIVDAQSGEVLDVNSYLLDFLDLALRDFLGRKLWEIPELAGVIPDETAFQILKCGDFVRVDNLVLNTRTRETRVAEFVCTVYWADDRRVMQCNLRDITARKQAEQALAESQMRLELAIQSSRVGPWEWDLVTNEHYCSPEWKNQIGHAGDTFSHELSEWEGRLHPEDHDRVMGEVYAYIARPAGGLDLEFRLRHKDGSYRWINSRGQLFHDANGSGRRLLGCHLDITERKSLEEQFRQAQKMESIGRLAGGVAHDFNNLLTIILGYSDVLLQDSVLDEGTRDSLQEIKRAGERAASLTRQLLAFSRKQVLEPAMLDVNLAVGDCEKILRRLLGADVELVTLLSPDLDQVKADAGQLEQVLLNLAINARDAMPQGGKLTIETSATELDETYVRQHPGVKPGRHVVLTVSDTGCGMDDHTKAHIFEPFFTTKQKGKGTGLGLAMVFGFIKQSGGHVAVASEPGKGSTFKIFLPAADGPPAETAATMTDANAVSGPETILLVEDETGVRTLAQLILKNCGYTVLAAARGDEALTLAQAHPGPIHLLISDVVMPGMGGRELADKMAAVRPGLKTLFMSGYTDDTIVRHGIQASETAFLHKPFTVDGLPLKVRKVLDQSVV